MKVRRLLSPEGIQRFRLPVLATDRPVYGGTDERGEFLDETGEIEAVSSTEMLLTQARDDGHRAGYQQGYEAGQREGYEKGFQEGAQEAEAQITAALEEHFNSLLTALKTGGDAIVGEADRIRQEFEQWLPRAVLLVSEHVLRREVEMDGGNLVAVIREGLAQFTEPTPVRVHLHPEDYARLAEQPQEVWESPNLSFLPDPAVSQGGALLESTAHVVDARLESRLVEAASALLFPQDVEGGTS